MTTFVIAITGVWNTMNHLPQTQVMAEIFANYIPFSETFMTIVLFFAGYTTIAAFFTVGLKSARFISPKYGKTVFIPWAMLSFVFFSYATPEKAKTVMLIAAMLLLLINTVAIFMLRKQIDFSSND
jgi:AGCS family alanine or glycine:cation symporter